MGAKSIFICFNLPYSGIEHILFHYAYVNVFIDFVSFSQMSKIDGFILQSYHKRGLDFCTCSLPAVNEPSLSNSSSSTELHNLLEIDDEDFLSFSHPEKPTNSARLHTGFQQEGFKPITIDRDTSSAAVFDDTLTTDYINYEVYTANEYDNLSISLKSGDLLSTTSTLRDPENPLLSFAFLAQDRSYDKEKLCNFSTVRQKPQSFSAATLRRHIGPVENFSSITYSYANSDSDVFPESPVTSDNDLSCLTQGKLLFDLSSGDSANISESESKMGDFPPPNGLAGEQEDVGGLLITSSEGEGEISAEENNHRLEVKDIGYSSDSLSNDEDDVLHHQIDIECKFPGKCEVASDGPLGDKVILPSVATRPEYYFMTLVDIDSTDKTDNGDTTDSGGGKIKKFTGHYRIKPTVDVSKLELLKDLASEDKYKHTADKYSHSVDDSWSVVDLATTSSSESYFEETKSLHENTYKFTEANECISPIYEFSDSDVVAESEKKNSIKYLIDHAEDLVKYPSPRKQQPKSPSKQTQTDSLSTVESSCDASAEDNSEFESHLKNGLAKEDLSTTTDEADETLFNSVINVDSAEESVRSEDLNQTILSSPFSPVMYDSPHLRKQTCRRRHQKGESRPWSVVGLDNISLLKKSPNHSHRISAVSESAINHLHFQTNNDLPSWLLMSSQSILPFSDIHSRRIHRSSTSCDQISRKLEYSSQHTVQYTCTETTSSTSCQENIQTADGNLTILTHPVLDTSLPEFGMPSQTLWHKAPIRHSQSKVSHDTSHSSERCSWASNVFNSAESETDTSG